MAQRTIEERNCLVEKNRGLAHYFASIIWKTSMADDMQFEDAVQWGMIGLIRAAELYEERVGKFSTFAYHHVRQQILRAANNTFIKIPLHLKEERFAHLRYGDRLRGICLANNRERLDVGVTVGVGGKNPDYSTNIDIAHAISTLEPRERAVAQLRYWEGQPYKVIGQKLGMSHELARHIDKGLQEKLRPLLGAYECQPKTSGQPSEALKRGTSLSSKTYH